MLSFTFLLFCVYLKLIVLHLTSENIKCFHVFFFCRHCNMVLENVKGDVDRNPQVRKGQEEVKASQQRSLHHQNVSQRRQRHPGPQKPPCNCKIRISIAVDDLGHSFDTKMLCYSCYGLCDGYVFHIFHQRHVQSHECVAVKSKIF